MNYFSLIGSVALINLLGAVSPGPDFLITVRNALTYSRKAGIQTGLGVAFGLLVHVSYCAAGIGLIISRSPLLFSSMKVVGGLYLAWMGLHALFSKRSRVEVTAESGAGARSGWKAFGTGFLTNLLNPKAMLFFLSLFTFVLNPMPPTWVILVCALIVFITAALWFSVVATFLTHSHVRRVFLRFERVINVVLGVLLLLLSTQIFRMLWT
jgi:RhtB (resistance to homoserine/threonine) family protein